MQNEVLKFQAKAILSPDLQQSDLVDLQGAVDGQQSEEDARAQRRSKEEKLAEELQQLRQEVYRRESADKK